MIKGAANKRSVWTVSSQGYPGSHFAVYPPKLIEPMILAGTSEAGCCAVCHAPVERVVERESSYHHTTTADGKNKNGPYANQTGDGEGTHDVRHGVLSLSKTTGWLPSCRCNDGLVPCTVLDPFMGSGTTAAVCVRLGRRAVGIDLSKEYIEMHAAKRVNEALQARPWGSRNAGLMVYDVQVKPLEARRVTF